MTFFYDLNKRLASIADKPQTQQLNERDMSRAAKGYEKYGKEGMEALSKAGQDGASEATMDRIRAKHDKYKKSDSKKVEEDFGTTAAIAGGAALGGALGAVKGRYDDLKQREKGATAYTPADQRDKPRTTMQRIRAAAGIPSKKDPNVKGMAEEYGPLEELSSALAKRAADAAGQRAYEIGQAQDYADQKADDIARQRGGAAVSAAKLLDPARSAYLAKKKKFTDYAAKAQDREAAQQLIKAAPMSAAMKRKLGLGEEGGVPMTPKQKSFAKLAPPADKITFADKIAGAKKEVDEMLGDVAAEAMRGALKGGQKKLDRNHNGRLDAEDFAMLRKGAGKQETDETRNRDLEDWYGFNEPKSSTKGQVHRGTYGTEYQGEPDDDDDIGQKKVKKAKSAAPSGEKRGRGRPKGTGRAIGAKGPSGKSKLLAREDDNMTDDVRQAMATLKKAGYRVTKAAEELDEKAVSQQQQKFMGMAHAMQKGEKIKGASAELKKVAKTMKPKDVEDFAKTKHKGLPKKVKAKEEVEETTVSGSVATAPEAPKAKSKGSVQFGKGIYDSMNRELEAMIAESMNIDMHMGQDENGQPNKALTVNATDEDAIYLGKLLKMAGVGGGDQNCPTCGSNDCGCGDVHQAVDENAPEWPTDTETSDDALQYAGGLNKPKTTIAGDGQTTVPVTAVQVREEAEEELDEQEQVMAPESRESELDEELQRMREMAGIREAAKPDFLDVDKDGNKKESMKKAAADAENEKKVEESILDMTRLWQAYKA